MGYRSEVVVATVKDNMSLIEALEECEADTVAIKDNAVYYYFYEYKWYESYLHVSKVMSEMLNCKTIKIKEHSYEYETDSYAFMRIGEDYDDIETHGDCYIFGIGCSRTIEVDEYARDNN